MFCVQRYDCKVERNVLKVLFHRVHKPDLRALPGRLGTFLLSSCLLSQTGSHSEFILPLLGSEDFPQMIHIHEKPEGRVTAALKCIHI